MAFERLQALGEERFKYLVNQLMIGTPAMKLARVIQTDWKEFQGVAEKTLTQQLNRMRLQMQKGAFGEEAQKVVKDNGKIDIRMLRGSRLDVLADLVALANVQRIRVQTLWEKEQEMKVPLTGLNDIINDTRDLLVQIQKVQFDLGIDEFKGAIPGRVSQETTRNPDGSITQVQTLEAVGVVEEVFRLRGIRAPKQVTDGSAR